MRILQVVPYFYPAWAYGGPAKLVYDTSSYFVTQDHKVVVYTSDAYDQDHRMPSSKKLHIKNLTVRYFRNVHNKLAYTYNIFFTPGAFLPAIVDVKKSDVIHIHDFYTPQNAWIAILAKLFHKPYILSVHGCLEEKRLAQRSLFKQVFLLIFGNWMLKNATTVVATSENEFEAYEQFGVARERIYSLGHGVSKEEFVTALTREASRAALKLPKNTTIVTFLGRIHRIKGLDILVEAISQLKDTNIHFVIAGSDDGYLPTLEKDIKRLSLQDKITLLGTCFGETKARLFKASDIFVYPSHSEGFSLGILEALAAGLPLVITTGCHFDLVAQKGAGMVVEPDPSKLASAMKTLSANKKLRQVMSQHASDLIHTHYSMSKIGNDLLNMYNSALKELR